MAYEKWVVEEFMDAWFLKDYSKISKDEFKIVYAEYQDTSGLYLNDDFEKQGYIFHLHSRINYVKIFLRLQREFIQEFDIPFLRDFPKLKDKYGYVLKWTGDKENFEEQLKKIESREIKHHSFLEEKIKEFDDANSKKPEIEVEDDELVLRKSRISFIRMLNSLGKIGYKLDKKITTVEELSLMIKQQMEEVEQYRSMQVYGR